MDGDKASGAADRAWTQREGTPLQSLPGFTVLPSGVAGGCVPGQGRPSFYLSHPQMEEHPWFARAADSDHDPESGPASDADSISSSTGGLFSSISIPMPKQQPTKKPLSPTPSFTYIDAKAAMAARKQTVSCCASKSVLKITLTFCLSFLLGMILTVIYMEVYLWRRR